jgi:RES domain-containing protein
LRPPQAHFQELELIFQRHAAALEAEVRALQQADETAQWSVAWKQIYNWHFAQCFARQKVLRNWAADASAWKLLPSRVYPNQGNRKLDLSFDRED